MVVTSSFFVRHSNFLNILQIGFGFALFSAAYQGCVNIQQFVITSTITDRNSTGNYTGPPLSKDAGYYSSAILYAFFTASNFFAPAIVDILHAKWSVVLGAAPYLLYILSFFYMTDVFFYISSALLGCGAGLVWVGEGTYMANNSTKETASRNSGIFWALYESSLIIGNLFVLVALLTSNSDNSNYIPSETITIIYICFSILIAVAILTFALLRKPRFQLDSETVSSHNLASEIDNSTAKSNNVSENINSASTNKLTFRLLRMVKLMTTKPMILLSVVFAFTGLEMSFFLGVYGTSVADTLGFGSSHEILLAYNGIFVGVGEILGGCIFGIFGKKLNRFGRIPVIILAAVVHMTAFIITFINIPSSAPQGVTPDVSYINPPNQYLALFCSFCLGFADSCWQTQILSLLTSYYSSDSAPAFGIYNFYRSAATCCAFFYSSVLQMQWQLLIMAIVCPIAGVSFIYTELITRTRK